MKNGRSRDRDRRALLLASIAVPLIFVAGWALPSLKAWNLAAQESAAAAAEAFADHEMLLASLPESLDSLESRRDRLFEKGSNLFIGRTDTGAASDLADLVGQSAHRAGVQIVSIEIQADDARSDSGTHLIGVSVIATGLFGDVAELLRLLEDGPRLVSIGSLSIDASTHEPTAVAKAVRVRIVVQGLALRSSSTGKAAP